MPARPQPRRVIPLDQLQDMVRETMDAWFRQVQDKTRAKTPEQLYGFGAEEVVSIHHRKHGFGRGVWFRLKDGRVFDAAGRPSEKESEWYQSSLH